MKSTSCGLVSNVHLQNLWEPFINVSVCTYSSEELVGIRTNDDSELRQQHLREAAGQLY